MGTIREPRKESNKATLARYAQMSVQGRPTLVFGLEIRDKRYDDAPQMIVREPIYPFGTVLRIFGCSSASVFMRV